MKRTILLFAVTLFLFFSGISKAQNSALSLPTPGVNTNYVAIPHQASMVGFQNITIEAWVRTGGITTANTILNKGAGSFDYQLGINATTMNPFFRAGSAIIVANLTLILPNVWTHLAVSYDGANARFYVNGTLAQTVAMAGTLGSSANEMRIGRGNNDPGSGNIEELRLWSVVRTQAQIDSNKCRKYPASFSSTAGLKALWHFDATLVDSVSGYNGTALGNVGYDTVTFPIAGVCAPSSVTPIGTGIPERYSLSQNYPNPFNPTTRIEFGIPKGEFVEIRLYDMLGKEVGILAKGPYEAGRYIFDLNAGSLPSGIYFYTITAGSFTDTKKMMLIK